MIRFTYTSFQTLSVFFLLFVAPMGSLYAQDSPDPSRDVEIKVFLIDVESVDTVKQKFTANLTIVMRWQDSSLAHDGPDSISMPLDDIWTREFRLSTGSSLLRLCRRQLRSGLMVKSFGASDFGGVFRNLSI